MPFAKLVLLLDDECLIAYALEGDLQALGATVLSVPTCQQALNVLDTFAVDVAILDFRIGDDDCTEVAESCEKKRIPYVITSGFDVESKELLNPMAWIDKPYNYGQIVDMFGEMAMQSSV